MRGRHLLVLLVLMLSATPLVAQETTGQITGRIVDTQGLAVPGATVTVTGPQGPKTVATNGEGRFSVPFLTPGAYTIRAELQGFKAFEQKDVRPNPNLRPANVWDYRGPADSDSAAGEIGGPFFVLDRF